MVPRQHNARGFMNPLRPPKVLPYVETAARAVIGPLNKTRRRNKTGSQLC